MARSIPLSLSPHICVLPSQDVRDLLLRHSLPPLHHILQSFSPLSQVTTRSTSLTPIPLPSFPLRFSDLVQAEAATNEDEEQRAERTMDWISSRVQSSASRWLQDIRSLPSLSDNPAPWWAEVKRCLESDNVPNRSEGWNHPVAIIYAVSTLAPNPLQALQELHSRPLDFPPWVDPTHLRYSLILHPSSSSLSDPIAESLFNAVKKQYGLHSFLLPMSLSSTSSPSPAPVIVSTLTLPPVPPPDLSLTPLPHASSPSFPSLVALASPHPSNAVSLLPGDSVLFTLSNSDAQQIARFTREFVTMSLVPWMEKAVVDWNELYSSSRRLPSRLFTSTRRLFGTSHATPSTPSPTTVQSHAPNSSISSLASRMTSHGPNSSVSSLASVTSTGTAALVLVTQQRRLAEFATILGDFKLAISVWEGLRKESKGGSDVLPLLLSPSPALPLLAFNAIQANRSQLHDTPALAQLRSLICAVRWDIGIDQRDLLGNILEGERWLVQAAGAAEEIPTALLLAHAAFLSSKRGAQRRSALWYMHAADKLEKAGLKPLSMYFFQKSHHLYREPRNNELSPSFWESEGKNQSGWRGFDAILPGIEHELGRLLYTTGDTAGAVRFFLGLLQGSRQTLPPPAHGLGLNPNGAPIDGKYANIDKVYLEDFRVALKHFKVTESARYATSDLLLQLRFCQVKQTQIRLPGDALQGDEVEWRVREEDWGRFWKLKGPEKLHPGGKSAVVGETFWLDLAVRNPLDVDVTLSALTLTVREASSPDSEGDPDFVEIEVIDDIQLGAKESRTIPVGLVSSKPATLVLKDVRYDFLGILPSKESLATRGRRLHDTPHQRQNKVYAPDVFPRVDVEEAIYRLQVNFEDDRHLLLAEGECKRMNVKLTNTGERSIPEIWLVGGLDDELWVVDAPDSVAITSPESARFQREVLHSSNSLAPREPRQIKLGDIHSSSFLAPGESAILPLVHHVAKVGEQNLCILLVFRELPGQAFHTARLVRPYEVRSILQSRILSRPFQNSEHEFAVDIDIENQTSSSSIRLTQITAMSPIWSCSPLTTDVIGILPPHQVSRASLVVDRQSDSPSWDDTRHFVADKLQGVLQGATVDVSDPPPIQVRCTHLSAGRQVQSMNSKLMKHFIHAGRRNHVTNVLKGQHPHIPPELHHSIFPLYNPSSLDLILFWEVPSQERRGHLLLPSLRLGAGHAALRGVLEVAERAKSKRSMYAETQRERQKIIRAIKDSEWNAEMNPITVTTSNGFSVMHDFTSSKSCRVPVTFMLCNHSLTHSARYVLTLPSNPKDDSLAFPSAHFVGRMSHRGELAPAQKANVSVNLVTTQPGSYTVGGWQIETEVGEPTSPTLRHIGTSTRQRYKQSSSEHHQHCVVVVEDVAR